TRKRDRREEQSRKGRKGKRGEWCAGGAGCHPRCRQEREGRSERDREGETEHDAGREELRRHFVVAATIQSRSRLRRSCTRGRRRNGVVVTTVCGAASTAGFTLSAHAPSSIAASSIFHRRPLFHCFLFHRPLFHLPPPPQI
ncbi:hypothetical protein PIB30_102544, partial [Stylosanthes scabra]|nr:hypothetical protein [Stylosanthes scabra]